MRKRDLSVERKGVLRVGRAIPRSDRVRASARTTDGGFIALQRNQGVSLFPAL
jgi:hypothetical protein